MNDPSTPHHHHLIHGEIVFKHKDHDQIHSTRVNGILVDPQENISIRLLGKAQQILQLNFHQRMQDESIQVLDVILADFSYLGLMTQEKFQAAPEGAKIVERGITKNPLHVVPDLEQAVASATKDDASNEG